MSKIPTIIPWDMPLRDWADQTSLELWNLGSIPRLDNDDWQHWAATLLNLPSIHGINIPSPYQFTDWRRWAAAFNLEMQSVEF